MNGPPRQAERVICPRRAGTAKVRPADLRRMNRQRGRVPSAEHHQTHPANLPGQKNLALHQSFGAGRTLSDRGRGVRIPAYLPAHTSNPTGQAPDTLHRDQAAGCSSTPKPGYVKPYIRITVQPKIRSKAKPMTALMMLVMGFALIRLYAVFVGRYASHFFEQAAQMVGIFETQHIGDLTDRAVAVEQ